MLMLSVLRLAAGGRGAHGLFNATRGCCGTATPPAEARGGVVGSGRRDRLVIRVVDPRLELGSERREPGGSLGRAFDAARHHAAVLVHRPGDDPARIDPLAVLVDEIYHPAAAG